MAEPFTLGVNYWPRRKAMYWWSDFDAGEVAEEFALLRELGMRMVRIFLLWDDWQPTPDSVSKDCLDHLAQVCDAAAANGLQLDVTFFTGHMSGPNWSPRWLLGGERFPHVRQVVSGGRVVEGGYRNPFIDPTALAAEKLLLQTVVGTFKSHPAIGMWNLGNEPDLFAHPPTHEIGKQWVHDMTAVIRAQDTAHIITCGLHTDSLMQDNGLRVDDVFGECDIAVMHAYPMYLSWSRGPLDPALVPYTCAVTSALSGKPTLMEEFGGCTSPSGNTPEFWEWTSYGKPRTQYMAGEDEFAGFIQASLDALHQTGTRGAMLWCFADYVPALWDRPPCDEARHERYFGLVRPDGSVKPHAKVIQKFAAMSPTIQPVPEWAQLKVESDTYYDAPLLHLKAGYDEFAAHFPYEP